MSFAGEEHLEGEVQQYENLRKKRILELAAIFIVREGLPEEQAISKAEELCRLLDEAKDDETGVTETLREAQLPEGPRDEQERRQIAAVAKRLVAKRLEGGSY